MTFVAPSWFSGMLIWASYILIPVIIAIVSFTLINKSRNRTLEKIAFVIIVCCAIFAALGSSVMWHYQFEVPSINEKTVTVASWQPKVGIELNENGLMVIDSADDLMMVTDKGEGFINEENFLFFKFNTRDIYNQLKVNGTYKIRYYGWREGFNNGFPNILSIEEVIDENHTLTNNNFGNSFVQGIFN